MLSYQREFLNYNGFRAERTEFQGRIFDAISYPKRVMSLNADGMDQVKTHLPSFAFRDKDTEKSRVQVHITGMC